MRFWFFKKIKKNKSTPVTGGDFFTDQYRKAESLGITKLSANLNEQLHQIPPSLDSQMEYYPCRITLKSGEILNNVYIAEIKKYLKVWGILPGVDPAKKSVLISDVIKIEESPMYRPLINWTVF